MGYTTKQSQLIKEFLEKNSDRHFSSDEVYFALMSSGESIGKTTVYRQLERLCDEGKARKFMAGSNGASCYQFSDSDFCHNHYHLKCSDCGKLFHVECDFLDRLSSHIYDDHKFTVDGSKTVLYGLCESCRKEKDI